MHLQSASRLLALTETEFEGQSVHALLPVTILYFPAVQAVHGPPLGPVYPRVQTHATTALLPTGETKFAGQAVQLEDAVAPTTVEYVLTLQSRQLETSEAPTAVEYFPAAQSVQNDDAEAPTVAEYLPATQSVQVAATEAPDVVENLPDTQSMHAPLPAPVLYLPGTHAVHVLPSGPE